MRLEVAGIIVATLLGAYLLWRFVEQPGHVLLMQMKSVRFIPKSQD